MALKHVINATEFATLAENLQAEYQVQTDGTYKLDLGGMFVTDRDPAALFSSLEAERAEHKKTKSHLNRLETEANDAKKAVQLAEAQKSGDIEQLKAVFQQQFEEQKKEYQRQVDEQRKAVQDQQMKVAEQLRLTEANKIATELFGTKAPIMVPHILQNMKAVPGDIPSIEFVNANGQPDLTLNAESYKKTFLTNPLFADMIVASHASGGGANDGTRSVSVRPDGTRKGFDDFNPAELSQLRKENPGEFDRLLAERDNAA